jgi:hypothetical protein
MYATHILVGNNLNVLHMASGLEDLTQDILGDTLIQAANVQRPLVRFRSSASKAAA